MSIHEGIVAVMAIFAVLGAIDRIFGGRLGLGPRFEEGIAAMGTLALAMVGMICLAPVVAQVLRPVVVPLYTRLGADPAMFAGTILANDMGGAALAQELAQSPEAAQFGGLIIGAMLGPTVGFTIPVALGILRQEDHRAFADGVLAGIITIPLGGLVGGLAAGFSLGFVLTNLVPIGLIAALIALGLWRVPEGMVKGFRLFGKGIGAVITLGLAAAIVEALTGLVVIPGMNPLSQGVETVGEIAILLAGAFPLVHVLTRLLQKPLHALGKGLGINQTAAAGLVASLANHIPMLQMAGEMDERGKVVNVAFGVSAAFVFGDHLGFTAGYDPAMLVPMMAAKLAGGVSAVAVALWMTRGKGV